MSVTGAADGPPYRLGVAIGDIVTGILASQGVLLALLSRQRTGEGQFVDIGMLDLGCRVAELSGLDLLCDRFSATTYRQPPSNDRPACETFTASDGDFVLAVGNDDQWRRFCTVAGLDRDERFETNRQRVMRYDELRPILTECIRRHTRQALD